MCILGFSLKHQSQIIINMAQQSPRIKKVSSLPKLGFSVSRVLFGPSTTHARALRRSSAPTSLWLVAATLALTQTILTQDLTDELAGRHRRQEAAGRDVGPAACNHLPPTNPDSRLHRLQHHQNSEDSCLDLLQRNLTTFTRVVSSLVEHSLETLLVVVST
ncbi:hypothetical protein Cni_G22587 [Canna indica]|uniref:Uncharacterized protein n=1 Tax=Canna indica TaxID=4628 RepID=A0AAQ3KUE1_9LILI|nr:hypothetical protein Cni_G22587 [Canna indica]